MKGICQFQIDLERAVAVSQEVRSVNSTSISKMLAQRFQYLRNVFLPEKIDVALMQAQIGFGRTI